VRSGRLHRLHQGVYVLGHRPATAEVRWAAAVMACGPEAVLSHRSAAAAWGIRDGESRQPSRRLSAVIDDLLPTESPLEDLFGAPWCGSTSSPNPLCQQTIEGFRVDFHWPAARLVVETDRSQHADPLRKQADSLRDNVLGLDGQLVLRYTKADLKRRHRRVAGQISAALAERGS
jgi:Protein of unknown function (DUF559)